MNAAYAPGLSQVPGVPARASDAAAHSLGEAYEVAARLGGPAGEALRLAARHSFVHGLHVTLLVSAGLLLAGAAMALRLPRLMHCEPDEAAPSEAAFGVTFATGVTPRTPPPRKRPRTDARTAGDAGTARVRGEGVRRTARAGLTGSGAARQPVPRCRRGASRDRLRSRLPAVARAVSSVVPGQARCRSRPAGRCDAASGAGSGAAAEAGAGAPHREDPAQLPRAAEVAQAGVDGGGCSS